MKKKDVQRHFDDRVVIDIKPSGNMWTILCMWREEYAVWLWDGYSSQGMIGSYFKKLEDALKDFKMR